MALDIFAPKALQPKLPKTPGQLEPDYHEEYQAWKLKPGPQTRSALLKKVGPVLDEAVHSFGAGSQGSPNLRTRAKLMAVGALDSYDPAKGSLRTHLLSNLRGLQRVGAGEVNIISMPEQVALDRQHLRESERELEDQLGRTPSDAALADHTGLSLKRLAYIRQGHAGVNTGGFSAGQQGGGYMPASRQAGQGDDDAWVDLVYHGLSDRDKVILQHTLGWHGHPVLDTAAIGKKIGMSPGTVSQRRKAIQAELDQRFTSELGI